MVLAKTLEIGLMIYITTIDHRLFALLEKKNSEGSSSTNKNNNGDLVTLCGPSKMLHGTDP